MSKILHYFKTTSPQGDGNTRSASAPNAIRKLFQNHIPARGRKRLFAIVQKGFCLLFQNHIPVRGRKLHNQQRLRRSDGDFKTTSPQGDGNFLKRFVPRSTPSFQNHIPARGRKLRHDVYPLSKEHNFKTTSPQGDGNSPTRSFPPLTGRPFQNHIPARGRKRFLCCDERHSP